MKKRKMDDEEDKEEEEMEKKKIREDPNMIGLDTYKNSITAFEQF